MTAGELTALVSAVATIAAVVLGATWRLSGSIRALTGRLDIITTRLEQHVERQADLATGLADARAARAQMHRSLDGVRDRVTRLEVQFEEHRAADSRRGGDGER